MLQFLANVAKGVPQKLEVLSQLVSSLFDLSPGISTYMKVCQSACAATLQAADIVQQAFRAVPSQLLHLWGSPPGL